LLSHSGIYVGDANAKNVGEKITDSVLLSAIDSGKILGRDLFDDYLQADAYQVAVPVNVGKTTSPWSFRVSVPAERMMDDVIEMRRIAILIGVVSVVVVAGILIWCIRNWVLNPVNSARAAALRMAEGDLSVAIHVRGNDEIAQLLSAMKTMSEKLVGIIANIRHAAQELVQSSEQIGSTSQSLSQAATQQAATVEETSASVEEISAAVAQNSDNE